MDDLAPKGMTYNSLLRFKEDISTNDADMHMPKQCAPRVDSVSTLDCI